MKKTPKSNGLFPWNLRFDLKMKLSLLFLITVSFVMQAGTSYSQKVKISLNKENATVKEIIDEIETTTEFKFLFNTKVVDLNRKVSLKVNKATINNVLDLLFKGEDTEYEIDDRKILLTKIKENKSIIKDMPNLLFLPTKTINGKVTDSKGVPLPGANVVEKGTNNFVTTSFDGNFSLVLQNENATLVVSFLGFETQEIQVKGQSNINVILKENTAGLNEVVVVGYGSQKKVNLTGSVSSVSGAVLSKRPVVNAATMLQGLMPGVNVVQSNGQPGQGNTSIIIRGLGTFSGAGASPLMLIDGVPGNIESLDPNTIESVSVLKDAASASIYGSRGANGVVLVTTKSGKNSDGKMRLEYNYNYGVHSPTKMLDMVSNSPDYMRAWNTRIKNSNYGVDIPSRQYPQSEIDKYTNPSDPVLYPSFDWVNFIIKPAPTVVHNINVSGGKQTHYNLNLGYANEKGTMEVFGYKRYNAQLNIVSEVNSKLTVGANFQLKSGITDAEASGQQNYFLCILAQPPTIMPTLADGSGRYTWRAYTFEENNWNPYKKLKEESVQTKDYLTSAQLWSDLEIIKGLHWNVKVATNYSTSMFTGFTGNSGYELLYRDPSVLGYQYVTSLTKSNTNDLYTNAYTTLNYVKKLGSHNIGVMAGYSTEEDNYNSLSGYRNSYASPSTPELNAGAASSQTNSGTSNSWAMQSGFGRVSYNFKEKYLLEGNLRYDGTSRLSQDTRWGAFPSVSAGWKFSEESFMQSTKSWLTNAKLRASWGKLGNQNIGLYPYQAMLSLTGAYPFDNSTLSQGVAQTALNNENIKWETTTTYDVGIDLSFFRKLSLSFDVYKKYTSDILRSAQGTGVLGFSAPIVNSGAMENKGIDLDLQYRDRVNSGFLSGMSFGGGLVLSAYHNKLVKFGARQDNGSTIYEEGRPWGTFYLLQTDGIFQSADEIAKSPKQFGENTQPGMLKFKDVNGDGKIDNSDRVPMEKGVFPAFSFGFNFSADWKGFDLYGMMQGLEGSKVYVTGWGIQPFVQGSAPTKIQLEQAWTPQNHSNTEVMLGDPTSLSHPSTYLLKDNSYLRLKTLQIGYSLPLNVISQIGMTKLRFYFAGDNLLTFTKYPGLDPERAGSGTYVSYPQNKVISFGFNVNF